jgi:hypothetical protein
MSNDCDCELRSLHSGGIDLRSGIQLCTQVTTLFVECLRTRGILTRLQRLPHPESNEDTHFFHGGAAVGQVR